MKRLLFLLIVCLATVDSFAQDLSSFADDGTTYGFIQNKGQVVDQDGALNNAVKYILLRPGLNVQVTNRGFSYDTYTKEFQKSPARNGGPTHDEISGALVKYHRVDISFPGSNPDVEIVATGMSADAINYVGEREIRSNHYGQILYKNLYDGIDLKLYTNRDGAFEYDLIIHPGADASQITLDFAGQNELVAREGKAIGIMVQHGELREQIPSSYVGTSKKNIDVKFSLKNNHSVSFDVPAYDRSQTLVIDPQPNLLWATYYGGTGDDIIEGVATDASNNIYVAGYTSSSNGSNIIATALVHQVALATAYDAFIASFNAAGTRLMGTYYGSGGQDIIRGIVVTTTGDIYVTGETNSAANMSTAGTFQNGYIGGVEAFVARFTSAGVRTWATYFGGSADDGGEDIFLSSTNDPIITGYCGNISPNSMTNGQTTFGGGTQDAFLASFAAGTGLRNFSSYFGGTGDDFAYVAQRDGAGNIYMAGYTNTTSGLATVHQTTIGGAKDGFVAKFSSTGVKTWMTYYGGTLDDQALSLDVAPAAGDVYVSGLTQSTTGISTSGVHKASLNVSGLKDGFIAKFNTSGVRQWGTYYGGEGHEELWSIAETSGALLVSGLTMSSSGVATTGSYQTTFGGLQDAVISKFDANGARQWASYFGGPAEEYVAWGAQDGAGDFIIAGFSKSSSGVSFGGHQNTFGGGAYDGFIAKFQNGSLPVPTIASFTPTSGAVGASVVLTGTNFETTVGNNTIYFGSTRAVPSAATANSLTVAVPQGGVFSPISVTTPAGVTGYSQKPFITTLANIATLSLNTFSPKSDLTGYAQPYGVVAGDFDSDGKADLAIANRDLSTINVIKNTTTAVGTITFATSLPFTTGGTPLHPVTADMDGDGKLDLITVNSSTNTISMLRNTSSGSITFATKVDLTPANPQVVAIEDLDSDGKPDIVTSNYNAANISIYGNKSNIGSIGMTSSPTNFTTGTQPYGVAIADIDGDSKKDIVVANFGGGTISVFRNTSTFGTIQFAAHVQFTVPNPWMVSLADFDNNGKIDIAVTSIAPTNMVFILPNTSDPGVISGGIRVDLTAGTTPSGIVIDDIDLDGKVDIVASNAGSNNVSVFKNNSTSGNLAFSTKFDFATGSSPTYVMALVDLDADQKKDLAVTNAVGNSVSIIRNNSVIVDPEPATQPTGFSATPASTSIAVSFTAATSFQTGYIALRGLAVPDTDPVDGVSYTVGTTLGNATVVHNSTVISFTDAGLTPSTQYNYKIYHYNGTGSFVNYRQVAPLQGNSTTTGGGAPEPGANPTAFVATPSASSILVSFTAPATPPDGYFALRGTAVPTTDPVDGTTYTLGAALGNGTVVYAGSTASFNDTGLAPGTLYNFKIYSFNGSGASINYRQVTPLQGSSTTLLNEPAANPTSFVGTPASTSISVSFTGNVTPPSGYIALRGTAIPDTDPVDGTTYTLAGSLGNAAIVLIGTSTSFNDTGLASGTTYNYKIYAFNGSGASINYRQLTPLQGSSTTTGAVTEPTTQPTAFVATPSATSIAVSFTAASPAVAGYIAIRGTAVPTTDPVDGTTYTTGTTLGNGSVAYSGSAASFNDTGLSSGFTYNYKIYSYNGSGAAINYRQVTPLQGSSSTLQAEPTAQPTAFVGTPSSTSIAVSFTAPGTPPTGYIALRGTAVPNTDPVDGTTYVPTASIGNATVVYIASLASFTDSGLTTGTLYNYKIYAYNGTGTSINYLQTSPLQGSATTTSSGEPTTQPTSFSATPTFSAIVVSFTAAVPAPGGYIAIRSLAVPNTDPADGTTYVAGNALGNAAVVYVGTATTFTDTGLSSLTTYNYKIYSYNGSGGAIDYRQLNPLTGNSTTLTGGATEPTAQPTAFSATPSSTSIAVTFAASAPTSAGYLALRSTSVPTTDPVDGITYTQGATLGNATVVFISNGTSFTDTGLNPGTIYNYKIYSFNGTSVTINYRQTSPLQGSSTTIGGTSEPTAQPTAFNVTGNTNSTLTISFAAATGSPTGYIAIRALTNPPTFIPLDGTTYSALQSVGTGEAVAFAGSGTSFTDTGLAAISTYVYRIYSYNGSGASINYFPTSPLQGSGATSNISGTPPPSFGKVTSPVSADLTTVRFVNATTAIVGGTGGAILKTIDGGSTWVSVTNPAPASRTIWNVFFSSATNGFAVGTSGLMMKTTDTGATWTLVTSGVADDLYAIHFAPSTTTGFAAGNNGVVIKTIDGGANWTVVASAAGLTDSYYNTVYFKDVNEGFIAGPDGIFKTVNGGTSWTSVSSEAINWVVFPTSTVGYGAGQDGTIVKTIDGGNAWTVQSTPTFSTLWSIHFVDQTNGFAVGDDGTALKTTNGGTSWQTTLVGIDDTDVLYSVHFGSTTNGVAVGEFGFIGKAQTEGQAIAIASTNFKAEIDANGATTIGFSIASTDVPRVTSVDLHIIGIRDEAKGLVETVKAVTTQTGGAYSISITDTGSEKIGYKYSFVVNYDAQFNRNVTTIEGNAYIKWSGANGLKLANLRSGTGADAYQLISVPLRLGSASVAAVFADDLDAYDAVAWRLWSATGNETAVTYSEKKSGDLEIGKGYWLIKTKVVDISLGDGVAYNATVDAPFKYNFITKGYWLIGNPYNFNVPWTAGGKVKTLRYWTGSAWSDSQTLEAYKGYFVDVETTGQYEVPMDGSFDGGRVKGFQFEQNSSSWELDIDLAQGDYKNELAKIGMHPLATLGYDGPDERVFPMPDFTQLPSMSIDRPEAGFKLEKDIVPSAANQTWEFTLQEKGDSRPVTMSWNKESIAAIGRDLYLFDEEQIALIDMRSMDQHHTQSNTRLKIITGDPSFVKSAVTFTESRIGTLYPNPASEGGFYVPVAMSAAGEVQVRIFDMQGREVTSQVHFAPEGLQNLSVAGLPDNMNGLYLVSTESVGSPRKVQKVIFK